MKVIRPVALACLVVLLSSGAVQAQTMYYCHLATATAPLTEIYTIDGGTAADALLMSVPMMELYGMSASGQPGVLFAADDISSSLVSINVNASTYFTVGAFGAEIKELAYDPAGGVLYGTDYISLYIVNQATGAATPVGPFNGPTNTWAMGYDSTSGTLYCVDAATYNLYQINTVSGAATSIGATGVDRMTDLFYDATTMTMFGIGNFGSDYLYVVNTATAGVTTVGPVSQEGAMGLAGPVPLLQDVGIPTLGIWGLMGLAILLGLGGAWVLGRRTA